MVAPLAVLILHFAKLILQRGLEASQCRHYGGGGGGWLVQDSPSMCASTAATSLHLWWQSFDGYFCHAMQGVLQLLEKAEIRDVFATAGVQFEQIKRMGRLAGVVLQLQGMMQKGFSKVC